MPAQASAPRARIQLSSSQRPLTFEVEAINERGESVSTAIAGEAPLTLYLDKREIVTLMTLGADPEALVPGQVMGISLPDAAERADVIAFLRTLE